MSPSFQPTRRAFIGAASACLLGIAGAPGTATAATNAQRVVAAARRQVGVTLRYDPAYSVLTFPNGDVERVKGVCTDVVIRAFRDALGLDLQALVNADMRANFTAYPKNWGLSRPDRNIDHRRVPNLASFWRRQGASLPVTDNAADWRPGDIFTAMVNGRLPHTGIVSDRKDTTGTPLVLHNIGGGTREEDALFDHKLTGHFRWKV